jgi:putative intracellular protease/amidase
MPFYISKDRCTERNVSEWPFPPAPVPVWPACTIDGDETCSEKLGHNSTLNFTYDQVDPADYNALVVLGGCATGNLRLNSCVLETVHLSHETDKATAA